jgi:1,4-alpha-glucan branching enzyme
VTGLGFTHVELMPVMEHPYGGSWGYQVTGYYAPTARFGDPDEFRYLVDHLHGQGIGVILDWVPAHFPRDDWALADFDGTPLYEDADLGTHPDWGTLIFDYRKPEVREFLIGSALYWCEEFRVDGLRVDAVASMLYLDYSRESGDWTPNEHGGNHNLGAVSFVRTLTETVRRRYPGVVLIAEESTSWPGVTRPTTGGDGLGFDLKWNLGWMHDTLAYLRQPPGRRRRARDRLTLPASYAFDERWLLPLSHDEVVHGKGALVAKLPGNRLERLAGLRGLFGYMWAFPGRKLLFMGSELAPDREWSEQHGLAWNPPYPGVGLLLTDLNRAYRTDPALWSLDAARSGFGWLVADDPAYEVVAFVRRGMDGSRLVCVSNFSDVDLVDYPVALPGGGRWREVINTEAVEYGGSGIGNLGAVEVRSSVANVQLAAHATVWLRPAAA